MASAKVISINVNRPVSLPILARLLNLTERRITQLAKEGVIPRSGRGKYPLANSVRGYITFLQQTASGSENVDPDKLEPFKRKAHYQAELDKLKLQTERGELTPRIQTEEMLAHAFKILGHELETIPDILERDTGATPQQLVKIEAIVDEAREQIYERLVVARKPVDKAKAA
jgi:hypothetical protein